MTRAERIEHYCELMHDAYERGAIIHGWETNPASRHQDWADVPEANKATMRVAVGALLDALTEEIAVAIEASRGVNGHLLAIATATRIVRGIGTQPSDEEMQS